MDYFCDAFMVLFCLFLNLKALVPIHSHSASNKKDQHILQNFGNHLVFHRRNKVPNWTNECE